MTEPRDQSSAASRDEPKAICANCDSWFNQRCVKIGMLTKSDDFCVKFFPDPSRWPDADHD